MLVGLIAYNSLDIKNYFFVDSAGWHWTMAQTASAKAVADPMSCRLALFVRLNEVLAHRAIQR
jgi:hypothetical protein